jgi:hypothetical protein
VQGAQWIVWPGIEPRVYRWNHGIIDADGEGHAP